MPPDSPQLTILVDGQVQQTVSLTMEVLRVGRTPENGLVLADREVSRYHAEFRRGPQGYALTDLGSTNGTSINDAPLSPNVPYLLHSGDRIKISRFLIVYEVGRPAPRAQPTPAAPRAQPTPEAVAPQPDERWGSQAIDLADRAARPLEPVRKTMPMPLAPGPVSRYLKYLPAIYSDDGFLGRYLMIIESLWEPLEQRQHFIHMYFDPRTAPVSFLAWLGTWMGLAIDARWPESRCRQLLSEALDLYRFRGTLYGLRRMIEIFTGITPEIIDLGLDASARVQPFVFRVRMRLSGAEGVNRELVEELINSHKPACAGYILEIER